MHSESDMSVQIKCDDVQNTNVIKASAEGQHELPFFSPVFSLLWYLSFS